MNEIKEITPQDLRRRLLDKEKILIVDVRTVEEYKESHLEDAFFMELSKFNQKELEEKCASIDNLQAVVFQCKSGVRSKNAMQFLENFAYGSYNLKGGIYAWSSLGYKVILDDDY